MEALTQVWCSVASSVGLAVAAVDSYFRAPVSCSECRCSASLAALESFAAWMCWESSLALDSSVLLLALESSEVFLVWEHWDSFAALCCPDSAPPFLVLGRLSRAPGPLYPEQAWPFPEPDSCWAAMCLASGMGPELSVPLRQRVTAVAPQSGRYSK